MRVVGGARGDDVNLGKRIAFEVQRGQFGPRVLVRVAGDGRCAQQGAGDQDGCQDVVQVHGTLLAGSGSFRQQGKTAAAAGDLAE